jgi:hypothetical protein
MKTKSEPSIFQWRKIQQKIILELSSAKKQIVDHSSYPSEQIFGGYRVVQKTRKDILTNYLRKITNQTKNQPSSLYKAENIRT